MGVTGLLPFLKKSTDQINICQFAGMTVAIDAYVWLHRGVFSCAEKLARGEKTTAYIYYGLKMLNMLLSHNIKPILVFDGRRLAAKKETETKRSDLRKQNRQKAEELLKAGRENEARDYLRRCVDITHLMALELIKAARKIKVDCIVAPHEADAQLAYLNQAGIAQLIITEDSDLILFGCNQILYKLDPNGNGLLLKLDRLHMSLGRPHESPQTLLNKLRQICILSGCDYVSSLQGVGLVKAKKFVMATSDPDFIKSIKRMPMFLNLRATVDDEYLDRVRHAELTFRKQLVFDPRTRRQLTLDGKEVSNDEPYSGEFLEPDIAFQLAVGNLDPFNLQQVDDFNPDMCPPSSIWNKDYVATKPKQEARTSAFVTTKGKEVILETKKTAIMKPKPEITLNTELMDQSLAAMYQITTSQRTVSHTELKTCVFDGKKTKEVVKSSYFSQNSVQTAAQVISPKKLFQKALEYESPKKNDGEILCKLEDSPSKLKIHESPLAKNPFAKKTGDLSPKLNNDTTILSLPDSEDDSFTVDNSMPTNILITKTTEETFLSNPFTKINRQNSSVNTSEIESQEYSDVQILDDLKTDEEVSQRTWGSQSSISSERGSQLDRFRFRKPLFKKSSQSDNSQLETAKSPILGKRKRNENYSPSKSKVTSSYFEKTEISAPLSPTNKNTNVPVLSSTSLSTKRNLSSVFQWSSSQEDIVETKTSPRLSSVKSSFSARAVGLRKISKNTNNQTSLYKFGFSKK